MKGKTFIALGLGAAGGFISGSAFTFIKMMEADEMQGALASILASKITDILFDDKPSADTSSRVRYHDCYSDIIRRTSYRLVEQTIFDTRVDAEKVLDQMQEIIDNYGYVCIQDFYDLCGISIVNLPEGKWGWTNLNKVEFCKIKNGWLIDMPRALPLS